MKKVLLASAALLALGTAAQAAEPVKLSLGGYMIENFGYAHNTTLPGKTSTDVQSDVNINFIGSTKLDNGLTIGVEVDTFGSQRQDSRNVNADCGKAASSNVLGTAGTCNGNSNTKRSFATVSGGFGTAIVGEREDVAYIVHNSAPDVGATGLADGSWFQWVASPTQHRLYNGTSSSRYDGRAQKISYVTPAFYGLAAAVSYVPSVSQGNAGHTTIQSSSDTANWAPLGMVNGADFGGDLYVGGFAYSNSFGDVKISADAGAGQANIANLTVYQGGLKVSYAGFTLGGSIFNRHVEDDAHVVLGSVPSAGPLNGLAAGTVLNNSLTKTAAYAGQSWDAGLSYTTGPYAVSLGYFHDSSKSDAALNGTGAADSTGVWSLAGAYTAGPGVAFRAGLTRVEYSGENKVSNSATQGSGWAAVTGVKVDF